MGLRVLVGCEFSGVVRDAFVALGCDAMSCDLLPTESPGPHFQGDIFEALKIKRWDLLIAHPPCTYLTVTGNRWYKPEYAERYPTRQQDRGYAMEFFMGIANCGVPRIAIENPVGVMSSNWRKPDQIIQPWQFGDAQVKKTCLWLKRLPKLIPTKIVTPEYVEYNSSTKKSGKSKYPLLWSGKTDAKGRSRTFQGIAEAMADQWTKWIL